MAHLLTLLDLADNRAAELAAGNSLGADVAFDGGIGVDNTTQPSVAADLGRLDAGPALGADLSPAQDADPDSEQIAASR